MKLTIVATDFVEYWSESDTKSEGVSDKSIIHTNMSKVYLKIQKDVPKGDALCLLLTKKASNMSS